MSSLDDPFNIQTQHPRVQPSTIETISDHHDHRILLIYNPYPSSRSTRRLEKLNRVILRMCRFLLVVASLVAETRLLLNLQENLKRNHQKMFFFFNSKSVLPHT
uniref:Uncharacterized protein n=1 Tax=Lactuca sativa TaxID=4236 RepID=A0A9R1VCF2_LACSA|nr:hypothetical protein LSAT_V11C600299990 [Lactuca sativa]